MNLLDPVFKVAIGMILRQIPDVYIRTLASWANIAYDAGVLCDPETGDDYSDEQLETLPDAILAQSIWKECMRRWPGENEYEHFQSN